MDRSPGFGSIPTNYNALLRLGFPSAPQLNCLTLLANITRRTVLQKVLGRVRMHTSDVCKHKVSGSLSLPSRGSFHRSFTVLFTIGHWVVFRLRRWSARIPTEFYGFRSTLDTAALTWISPTGLSPFLACFPKTVRLSSLDDVLQS